MTKLVKLNSKTLRKTVVILSWLVVASSVSAWVAWQPAKMMISHNPQNIYCEYQEFETDMRQKGANNFLIRASAFIPYSDTEPGGKKIFRSYGEPCRLTNYLLGIFWGICTVVFLFIGLMTYGLIKVNENN